jgi:hypothetical protein
LSGLPALPFLTACPVVGSPAAPGAGSGLLSCSWLVALCSVSDVTLSLAWAGCFLLPLCGLFLLSFVSPSICALTAVIFCFLVSAVFQYYFLLATIFFCSSTIFVSLRFSSVLLCDLPFPFPCDLLFSFSCVLLFILSCALLFSFPATFYLSFPAIFYFSFPAGFSGFLVSVRGFFLAFGVRKLG